jgi:hypothetical protein
VLTITTVRAGGSGVPDYLIATQQIRTARPDAQPIVTLEHLPIVDKLLRE